MKITVVGAGAVGASCAEYIAIKDFASEVKFFIAIYSAQLAPTAPAPTTVTFILLFI